MPLPVKINVAVNNAIALLEQALTCSNSQATTHRTVFVTGWANDRNVMEAIATYLVGLLASAISAVLEIRAQIEDTEADRLELVENVHAIVGAPASPLTPERKRDERNPWIAEGLWHLCLLLAKRRVEFHPPGEVVALHLPHVRAKDHGFDVFAIYRTASTFGVTLVESKAYEMDPARAIRDATTFFCEVDEGKHDSRIRQAVASMRAGMSHADQLAISPSLWKSQRVYLPNPHYDSSAQVDWALQRPVLQRVSNSSERVIIMPHAISGFSSYFDNIGTAMQDVVQDLVR